MSKTVNIDIIIDTNSMLDFFSADSSLGESDSPYKANNFCQVKAVGSISTGIHNVFGLEDNTSYNFNIHSSNGDDLDMNNAKIVFAMIKDGEVTDEDWKAIIATDGTMSENGEFIIISTNSGFIVTTSEIISKNYNLQYSIIFGVKVNGELKYGIIDPYIANNSRNEY